MVVMSTAEMLYKPEQGCRDGEGGGIKSDRAEIPPPNPLSPPKNAGEIFSPRTAPNYHQQVQMHPKPHLFPHKPAPLAAPFQLAKAKTFLGKKNP